jgi:hypothetical protein
MLAEAEREKILKVKKCKTAEKEEAKNRERQE